MLIGIIVLLILVFYTLNGYRNGLLLSLCTLLILVLSATGASIAQTALTPAATAYAEPIVAQALEANFREQMEAATQDTRDGLDIGDQKIALEDMTGILSRFGIDTADIAMQADDAMQATVSSAARSIAHAVVPPIAGLVVFLAAFLILYLVLHSLTLVVNLVDRLPVIHTLNHLGGAVMGLLSGLLLLTLLSVVFARAGLLPETMAFGPLGLLFQTLGV